MISYDEFKNNLMFEDKKISTVDIGRDNKKGGGYFIEFQYEDGGYLRIYTNQKTLRY